MESSSYENYTANVLLTERYLKYAQFMMHVFGRHYCTCEHQPTPQIAEDVFPHLFWVTLHHFALRPFRYSSTCSFYVKTCRNIAEEPIFDHQMIHSRMKKETGYFNVLLFKRQQQSWILDYCLRVSSPCYFHIIFPLTPCHSCLINF